MEMASCSGTLCETGEPFESLSDYMTWVAQRCANAGETWVFRGQREQRPLLPTIARGDPAVDPRKAENTVSAELRKLLPSLSIALPSDDWGLFALAQHHGAPTRFLDWSRDPKTALWFSVCGNLGGRRSPKTYVYAVKLTQHDFFQPTADCASPFQITRTKFYQPPLFDRRIECQKSVFSVHRYWEDGQQVVPLEANKEFRDRVILRAVSGTHSAEIYDDLRKCGIYAASLMPDIAGICQHVSLEHERKPKFRSMFANMSGSISMTASLGKA
jgi:hypothetical protein